MQDRFKFRLYEKVAKKMHYDDFTISSTGFIAELKNLLHPDNTPYPDDFVFNRKEMDFDNDKVLMYSTGLKDKNNNLIYEGDIVHKKGMKNYKNEKLLSEVIWSDRNAAFMLSDENGLHVMPANSDNVEILGNIYEDSNG